MLRLIGLSALLLSCLYVMNLQADEHNTTSDLFDLSRHQKVVAVNAVMGTAIVVWGSTQWNYWTESVHRGDEGWFEKETSNGGADKLGHFYTNYLITRILAPIYEYWGYSEREAAGYAALTTLLQAGIIMELGDATSDEHGFSTEDFLMDALGSVVGYYWYLHPSVAEKVDFRVEWAPDLSKKIETDITTDYESMKYLMAVKADGFDALKGSWAQYFELHFGYYSRHFHHNATPIEERERYFYAGVGLNLSHLLHPYMGKYAKIFNYYQVPYTYIPYDRELKP